MSPQDVRSTLYREVPKSVLGAVAASLVPALLHPSSSAAAIRPLMDAAIGLTPAVFVNAFMSAFVPAVVLVRLHKRHDPVFHLAMGTIARAILLIGTVAGATTIVVLLGILALGHAIGVTELGSFGTRCVSLTQAIAVAVILSSSIIIGVPRYVGKCLGSRDQARFAERGSRRSPRMTW